MSPRGKAMCCSRSPWDGRTRQHRAHRRYRGACLCHQQCKEACPERCRAPSPGRAPGARLKQHELERQYLTELNT
eukprot:5822509-Amphidinium_carterae.1